MISRLAAAAALTVTGALWGCGDSTSMPARSAERSAALGTPHVSTYQAFLDELNGSGVSGVAQLTLAGDQLTVSIDATGLEVGQLHPQHIHGWQGPATSHPENNANSTCPPDDADTNGDGVISLAEGIPFFGPVQLNLTPFTTAPGGAIDFTATYTVAADDFRPLQNRSIVLHGLTVNGVYVTTLPVACGQLSVD